MPSKSPIDEILDRELAAPVGAPTQNSGKISLPTALPDMIEDKTLIPRLSDSPEKQLVEYRVRVAAQQIGVDPDIAAAIAKQESGFNPDAVSPTGVRGTMQVTKPTASGMGFDRNDPDENILAGVSLLKKGFDKHPDNPAKAIEIYPNPADRHHYIPSVLNYAQQSKNANQKSIDDILNEAGVPELNAGGPVEAGNPEGAPLPQGPDRESGLSLSDVISGKKAGLQESQVGAAGTLAGAKSFLDALGVGAIERGVGKIPGARKASEVLNNLLTGEKKSFNQRATENQAKIKAAQEEHPIVSGAGTVAGVVGQAALLNPAFKALGLSVKGAQAGNALSKSTRVANAAKALTQGAVQGGTYEGLSNENATVGSVGKAAALGATTTAVMAPVLAGVAKAGKAFGNALVNFAIKTGKPEVANYISKEIGPTLNKASMITKNQAVLDKTEAALQKTLSTGTNAKKFVDIGDKVVPEDIMKIALRKANAGLREDGDKLLRLAAKLEQGEGKLSLADANDLKRVMWKESKFRTSGDPSVSDAAQFAYKAGSDIMAKIEQAAVGSSVRNLNQTLARGIELDTALSSVSNPNRLRAYMELGTAIAHPGTIPVIAAERAVTSIPGATTIQALTGKVPQAVNPQIQTLLNALAPQKLKE